MLLIVERHVIEVLRNPLCSAGSFLQEMARSRPIDSAGQRGFKVLVLDEVDRLSKDAQHSLRRTMEKYSAACRLVLCCNNVSKVSSWSWKRHSSHWDDKSGWNCPHPPLSLRR